MRVSAWLVVLALLWLTGCRREPEPIIIETPALTATPAVEATRAATAAPRAAQSPTRTPRPTAAPAAPAKVNINTAGESELDRLPRIGPALARRIVEYRRAHGLFTAIDALKDVPGIGSAIFDAIKDWVTID